MGYGSANKKRRIILTTRSSFGHTFVAVWLIIILTACLTSTRLLCRPDCSRGGFCLWAGFIGLVVSSWLYLCLTPNAERLTRIPRHHLFCFQRSAFCVLRFAFCVLRFAFYARVQRSAVLRFAFCVLRFAFCVFFYGITISLRPSNRKCTSDSCSELSTPDRLTSLLILPPNFISGIFFFVHYFYIVPAFQLPHHFYQAGIFEIEVAAFPGGCFVNIGMLINLYRRICRSIAKLRLLAGLQHHSVFFG